jgi:hypothetical protein
LPGEFLLAPGGMLPQPRPGIWLGGNRELRLPGEFLLAPGGMLPQPRPGVSLGGDRTGTGFSA